MRRPSSLIDVLPPHLLCLVCNDTAGNLWSFRMHAVPTKSKGTGKEKIFKADAIPVFTDRDVELMARTQMDQLILKVKVLTSEWWMQSLEDVDGDDEENEGVHLEKDTLRVCEVQLSVYEIDELTIEVRK